MWGRSRSASAKKEKEPRREQENVENGYEGLNGVSGVNGSAQAKLTRAASHAGSWYTSDSAELDSQLSGWLRQSGVQGNASVRAIIAPHAGYRYSGRCAAYAFGHIDPSSVSRIFVLGPSHHHFTRRCMLTSADVYSTPIGDVVIDTDVLQELRATEMFEDLPMDADEAEHSLEMHLPYLVKMMHGRSFKLVPIVVGSLQPSMEAEYGKILAPYFQDSANFFSVSSDFCHWGSRFSYTPYDRSSGAIYESIEALDREGMEAIETGCCKTFTTYLRRTENTICGRHPISVLLSMMEQTPSSSKYTVRFVHYEQSSKCISMRDSSVSYASGVVVESVEESCSKKKVRKDKGDTNGFS